MNNIASEACQLVADWLRARRHSLAQRRKSTRSFRPCKAGRHTTELRGGPLVYLRSGVKEVRERPLLAEGLAARAMWLNRGSRCGLARQAPLGRQARAMPTMSRVGVEDILRGADTGYGPVASDCMWPARYAAILTRLVQERRGEAGIRLVQCKCSLRGRCKRLIILEATFGLNRGKLVRWMFVAPCTAAAPRASNNGTGRARYNLLA